MTLYSKHLPESVRDDRQHAPAIYVKLRRIGGGSWVPVMATEIEIMAPGINLDQPAANLLRIVIHKHDVEMDWDSLIGNYTGHRLDLYISMPNLNYEGLAEVRERRVTRTEVEITLKILAITASSKKATMSQRIENIAIIANDNVTTLKGFFTWDEQKVKDKDPYTFKATRQFANTVKPGDSVIVETKNGLSVIKVSSIDEFSDVEPESTIEYRWAFAKVETAVLDQLTADEKLLVERLKTAQRRSLQSSTLSALGISSGDITTLLSPPAAPVARADNISGVSGGQERVGGGIVGDEDRG